MSILEIIIYSCLALAVTTWLVVNIVKFIKHKKTGEKKDETERNANNMR